MNLLRLFSVSTSYFLMFFTSLFWYLILWHSAIYVVLISLYLIFVKMYIFFHLLWVFVCLFYRCRECFFQMKRFDTNFLFPSFKFFVKMLGFYSLCWIFLNQPQQVILQSKDRQFREFICLLFVFNFQSAIFCHNLKMKFI